MTARGAGITPKKQKNSETNDSDANEVTSRSNFIDAQRQKLIDIITTALKSHQRKNLSAAPETAKSKQTSKTAQNSYDIKS